MRTASIFAILLIGFAACDSGHAPAPRRTRQQSPPPPVSPQPVAQPQAPQQPAAGTPVSFRGKGFLNDADLDALGVYVSEDFRQKVRAAGQDVVEHGREGDWGHVFKVSGDLEVHVRPCANASEAADRCSAGYREAEGNRRILEGRGFATHTELAQEAVIGSNSWVFQFVRREGQGVVQIGFHKGPFYVRIIRNENARSAAELPQIKERALQAARHVASKL